MAATLDRVVETRTPPERATLAERMSRRDRAAFVGRSRELRLVDELFRDDPPASVLLVHGPAGIGKSVLLREIERRGRRAGWTALSIDGQDVAPVPDALAERIAAAYTLERPLVLIDGYERISALGGYLHRVLLPALPEHAIVVIAGRRPPARGWFEGGWESLVAEMVLGPLSAEASFALLANRGLARDRRAAAIARWAGGSPLALRLAAAAARADAGWVPEDAPPPARSDVARAVREALRSLHVPSALAQNPLARGEGVVQRAASVRALIREAIEHAFGETQDERLLKRVLVHGYVEPAPSHEQAAERLHVSRSTYFRRLKAASDRVASYLSAMADPV